MYVGYQSGQPVNSLDGLSWNNAIQIAEELGRARSPQHAMEMVLEAAMPRYQQEMRRYRPFFYAQGRAAGDAVVKQIEDGIFNRKPRVPKITSPAEAWAKRIAEPVVDPLIEGVTDAVRPLATKAAVGAGAAVGGAALLTLLAGVFIGKKLGGG